MFNGEVALLKQRLNQFIGPYNRIVLESKYSSRKSKKKWDSPKIMMSEEEFSENQRDVRIRFWRL